MAEDVLLDNAGRRPPSDVIWRMGERMRLLSQPLLTGPRWRLRTAVTAQLVGLFMAFPSYSHVRPNSEAWRAVLQRGNGDLFDQNFPETGRAFAMSFRAAVPAVAKALSLVGLDSVPSLLVVHALFGVLLLCATLTVVDRVVEDRLVATTVTLALALTYGGVVGFVELGGNLDAMALGLVAVACAARRPLLIGAAMYAAMWTDEAAIVAAGSAALFLAIRDAPPNRPAGWSPLAPSVLAVVAAGLAFAATRVGVTVVRDLQQPSREFYSPGEPFTQINNLFPGWWSGLEGLWLLVAAGVVAAWQARQRLLAVLLVVAALAHVTLALSVIDITRRMIFALPVVFAALALLRRVPVDWMRRATLVALIACLVWPVYYVGGEKTTYWVYPLPLQLARMATGLY